jgi:hypothetical protein
MALRHARFPKYMISPDPDLDLGYLQSVSRVGSIFCARESRIGFRYSGTDRRRLAMDPSGIQPNPHCTERGLRTGCHARVELLL